MADKYFGFNLFTFEIDYSPKISELIPSSIEWRLAIGHWTTMDYCGALLCVSNVGDFDFLSIRPIILEIMDWYERRR